jgi:glycogen debranching enzyme
VRSSNAGHCLTTGIALPHRAERLADELLSDPMFSGWGIRTLAATERRFNPLSYHNGSIWPHDNALIVCGLARYGFKEHALRVFEAMFEASQEVDLHRLPELFCGLPRRPGEGPTLYPVACSPQAWAAATVFYMLQAVLGLEIDATANRVCFVRPVLPRFLSNVRITGLRVGDARIAIDLHRYPDNVGINITERAGSMEIITYK